MYAIAIHVHLTHSGVFTLLYHYCVMSFCTDNEAKGGAEGGGNREGKA